MTNPQPRESVLWFAGEMERQLRENDHKGGWMECSPRQLLDRLREELIELHQAVDAWACDEMEGASHYVVSEAADVANFAMMIANICGWHQEVKHEHGYIID